MLHEADPGGWERSPGTRLVTAGYSIGHILCDVTSHGASWSGLFASQSAAFMSYKLQSILMSKINSIYT